MDIEKELIKRIDELESKTYIFPEKFTEKDYIFTAVVILICLIVVIGGALL